MKSRNNRSDDNHSSLIGWCFIVYLCHLTRFWLQLWEVDRTDIILKMKKRMLREVKSHVQGQECWDLNLGPWLSVSCEASGQLTSVCVPLGTTVCS